MKTYQILASFLMLIISFTSCKKEIDSENPPSSSSNPLPVVFTSNVNLIDEGTSVTMNGSSDHSSASSSTPKIAGEIMFDSLLSLYFIDEVTNMKFNIAFNEFGGDIIQPGTYSFASLATDYQLSMTLEGTPNDHLYMYGNTLNNQGLSYNGQPIVPNGTLTITSLSQTSISGTVNCELYSPLGGPPNVTHKVVITNGSFDCDIVRY